MVPLFGFLHPWELIVIGGIVLLLFGNRLPSLMRSVGRSVVEFKHGIKEDPEGGDAAIGDQAKAPTAKP